jgi:U3 small nucleolar RNA-associated protein 21
LKLKNPISSIDFDPSGDFLATTFSNSKEVYIWTNKIGQERMGDSTELKTKFATQIKMKEWGHSRKKYIQDDSNLKKEEAIFEDEDINKLKKFLDKCSDKTAVEEKNNLVDFLHGDITKWLPLIHLDEIKEKNKPKSMVEENPQAPFYLNFDNKIDELDKKFEGDIKEEKDEAKSKIIKSFQRNDFLEEVGSKLENLVSKIDGSNDAENFEQIYKEMKKLNPSQLDYEMRQLTFGNFSNVSIAFRILNLIG